MKVKKIGALCKARGTCCLFDELTEAGEIVRQWISNGAAMWPVSGLPILRESNLATLFDFSPETVKKMRIKETEMPETFYGILHDLRDGEAQMQESAVRILRDGEELMALTAGATVIWLKTALLAPCWSKETVLVQRECDDVKAVAVLDGLFLSGIILPAVVQDETFRELLRLGCSAPRPVTPAEEIPEDEDDADQ